MAAGTVRNCLVEDSQVTLASGGGILQSGGTLINSTVVANHVDNGSNPGGGVWWTGGSITNTIVYGNLRLAVDNNLYASSQTTIGYSCAPELTGNVNGNLAVNPSFKDSSADDYRLAGRSPCIDKGVNISWMVDGLDLDGIQRRIGPNGHGCL